jgi:hypothetical protein
VDGVPQDCELEYESILIKADGVSEAPVPAPLQWTALKRTIGIDAFRRASLRRRGLGKFASAGGPRVAVRDEGYTIVETATLAPAMGVLSSTPGTLTQTDAEDLMAAATAANEVARGSVMVLPQFEGAVV